MTAEEEARKEVESSLYSEPPTETPKEKTKTELFTERLNTYPDLQTAKDHLKEIADDLKVAKALGYKALKKTRFFIESAKTPRPEVPTVKIPEAPTTEIITEEPTEPPSLLEERKQAPLAPTEAEAIPEAPPTPMIEKLQPIFERSMQRLINNGMEALTGAKDLLDTQEAKDTAILMPILIYRLTRVALTEDQFIDVTIVTHFGSIVVKVINKRRQQPKPPKTEPAQTKAPEKTERPIQQPPTEKEIAEMKQHQQPPFLSRLS